MDKLETNLIPHYSTFPEQICVINKSTLVIETIQITNTLSKDSPNLDNNTSVRVNRNVDTKWNSIPISKQQRYINKKQINQLFYFIFLKL